MYKHLLVATDGSKLSNKAIVHAVALAKSLGARLTAFYASSDYPMAIYAEGIVYEPLTQKEYAALAAKEAAKAFAPVLAKAKSAGVDCGTQHVVGGTPWMGILNTAKKAKCDAIVMASHGRTGISAVLIGSETQKVLTHSKLPVLVVR